MYWPVWWLISLVTSSPLMAGLVLLALWWASDRFTFRVLPDPVRWMARWRRMGQLRRTLGVNPHDRRARFELAERLLEARRPRQAAATLRPNIEAGDDDAHTAFVMGAALGRSGAYEPAERALALVRESDPRFRAGETELELGRQRLARRDYAAAGEALERLLEQRPGSVEGRWLLSRVRAGLGDSTGAAAARDQAWRDYRSLPRFHRRHERPYAWRAQPWRPALSALVIVVALMLFTGWVCGP